MYSNKKLVVLSGLFPRRRRKHVCRTLAESVPPNSDTCHTRHQCMLTVLSQCKSQ